MFRLFLLHEYPSVVKSLEAEAEYGVLWEVAACSIGLRW